MKTKNIICLDTLVEQNSSIDAADLNGEKVMMNLDLGQYFALNEVGSRIWEIMNEPISVNDIISKLLDEYSVDSETCKNTVLKFLESMNDAELINIY